MKLVMNQKDRDTLTSAIFILVKYADNIDQACEQLDKHQELVAYQSYSYLKSISGHLDLAIEYIDELLEV